MQDMNDTHAPMVLIRGGGDLASGVALRLFHSGFKVVITEIAEPLAVRRGASFAQAVFDGVTQLEGVLAVRCNREEAILEVTTSGKIAVRVDPSAECRQSLPLLAVIEGRMLKKPPVDSMFPKIFTIGLGPGFTAGVNCHAVVETNRGHRMGRVYWQGSAEDDTTQPEAVKGHISDRVVRADASGLFCTPFNIGDIVDEGAEIGDIAGKSINSPFKAVIRGMLRSGTIVQRGMKIGDLDPRCDRELCYLASDKALAVGGGVLEALLTRPEVRAAIKGGA